MKSLQKRFLKSFPPLLPLPCLASFGFRLRLPVLFLPLPIPIFEPMQGKISGDICFLEAFREKKVMHARSGSNLRSVEGPTNSVF